MNDYERIARVIRYLDEHQTEQPELSVLAQQAGLSASRFHRLFVNWAGITPKDFLQSLTLTRVKELLRRGASVLDASLGAGLSGPGRAHDLCVELEGASPGEVKSGGEGWIINAGFANSPFGTCLIATGPRGLCHLSFIDGDDRGSDWAELRGEWPKARLRRDNAAAARTAEQIFMRPNGSQSRPPLRTFVRGTDFQVRVWRALLEIPPGTLTTYGRLAAALGDSNAARAVGSAIGQNDIAYLIPCHRVIRETGVIGDYRWGGSRKRAMVAWEASIWEPADELRKTKLMANA